MNLGSVVIWKQSFGWFATLFYYGWSFGLLQGPLPFTLGRSLWSGFERRNLIWINPVMFMGNEKVSLFGVEGRDGSVFQRSYGLFMKI
jgi:hypothetical protein